MMATRKERGGSSDGNGIETSVRSLSVMRQDETERPWKSHASVIGLSESFASMTAASFLPLAAAAYRFLQPVVCTATAVPRLRSSLKAVKA